MKRDGYTGGEARLSEMEGKQPVKKHKTQRPQRIFGTDILWKTRNKSTLKVETIRGVAH